MWSFIRNLFKSSPIKSEHKAIKTRMDRLFTWVDQSKGDVHQTYVTEYYASVPFKDDCDGYAATIALVLAREGYRLRDIYLVNCWTWKDVYHQVCLLATKEGLLVFDNNLKRVVTLQEWVGFTNGNKPHKIKCLLNGQWVNWYVPNLST